ncbi:LysM peptidoglycan-binding domain-containing protein [Caulobacter sp. UNC279MFTsu5.1]|uniref:cell division endopeptidase DipM n=1 Tax=Caulobacter sp. UNC279MFTsu5.1 TaxID=1502775 RepID=UPI0008E2DD37|nr:LysM peptidoglycan-binding domain-containing protein [Caulobacter sp. UNC279MFTsu5.1]SFJ80462.1 Murein DD-endopeptidase MepM and murein hydrolase activator NlpD, contain LysM domain [Caulobacter sp. UNC279MFTsu5.1]
MRQLWTRAAVIALTAGTLAACESTGGAQYPTRTQTPTPNFPIVQAPPANQQPEGPSTPPDEPQPSFSAPAGNVGVSSQPLAPATTTQPPPPPPVAETRPAPAPTPAARPVVVTTVGGPVVTIAGPPKSYKVKSGDNIDAIARTLGTTRAQLAKDNDLKAPYRIHPGLVLQGPETKDAKAYVVQTGDTMFAIAKRFSVSAAALAEENDLSAGSPIRKGQKLRLPDGYRDKGPSRTTVMQPVAQGPAATPPQASVPSSSGLPPIGRTSAPAPSRDVEEDEAPAARPVTTTTVSVTGPVVEVAGPRRTYTVKSGDAIDAIARGLDTTRADLAKDNDLEAPYRIKPGQKLKGPATTAKAYVVQTGDTLANVAKRFNVKPAALAEENDIRTSAAIKKGQKLRLPSGYKDKGPLKTTVTTAPAAPRPATPRPTTPTPSYTPPAQAPTPTSPPASLPSSPRPYTPSPSTSYPRTPTGPVSAQPVTPPPSAGQIIGSSPPPTEAEITAAGRGRFVWPLQGETISDFGAKGVGQRNDGVNIRAPAGTPVRAAAAGEVVYAGNQVPGFGNLVLVKHADGWVTAYAHLSTTEVKMRQQVAQGATLGAVGQTGGVTEPQLHFEVRYAPTPKDKARPVDPGLVLPR